jgi:hypothetical protein
MTNVKVKEKKDDGHVILLGLGVWLVVGLIFLWHSDKAQAFLIRNAWPLAIAVGLAAAAGVVMWYRKAPSRAALFTFTAIPLLTLLVMLLLVLPEIYQISVLRGVFLLIVCLLPATMYYLFIASRKKSLLQEYFTNLTRLGLFRRASLSNAQRGGNDESELERRVRVMGYIQKFEAVYGPISQEVAADIIAATDHDNSNPTMPRFHEHSTGGALDGVFTPQTSIPVVLATLLIGLGWLLTLPVWEIVTFPDGTPTAEKLKHVLQPGGIAVHFALLGAYFFSLQMLFRRYVRKDLQANAYMAVSLRIILAVIGTWAVIQAATILQFSDEAKGREEQALLVLAFVVGAFPPVAWQVVRSVVRRLTRAETFVPSLSTEMPVSQLDGLTVWHEARLEEEDIENVPNMATADIVELMLHTRVPPDRIVDWVDQAILYTQLGPDIPAGGKDDKAAAPSRRSLLREHGIRTATDLITAYERSEQRGDVDVFEGILPGQGRSRIRCLVDTLCTSTNLELVQEWRRLSPLQGKASGKGAPDLLAAETGSGPAKPESETVKGPRGQVLAAFAAQAAARTEEDRPEPTSPPPSDASLAVQENGGKASSAGSEGTSGKSDPDGS